MATQAQLERLIGKALLDNEFRAKLLGDPEAAAKNLRIRLEPVQIMRLGKVDPQAADNLAAEFRRMAAQTSDVPERFSFW
jgi:hypothetical protein